MPKEISFADFMLWLEGGGFDLPAFRKNQQKAKVFRHCEVCVMSHYLREKVSPKVEACGNTCYWLEKKLHDLPLWAIKVVAKFDENYLTWSSKKMIQELRKIGESV